MVVIWRAKSAGEILRIPLPTTAPPLVRRLGALVALEVALQQDRVVLGLDRPLDPERLEVDRPLDPEPPEAAHLDSLVVAHPADPLENRVVPRRVQQLGFRVVR